MLTTQLVLGTAITLALVVFHVGGLVALSRLLPMMSRSQLTANLMFGRMLILITTVLVILAIHTVEAWVWAGVFLYLGEFTQLTEALYFSVVTSTTLGYGDLTLSDRWQLLGTFEAMGGLILFGASTAFLFEVMRKVFSKD